MQLLDNDECLILLELLLRRSITGYAIVARDGRFLAANPTFCRILEYSEAELRHKRFHDVTDPDDLEADVEMAKLVAEGECEGYDMTKSYITKTKKHQLVLLRVTALRTSGKFICFVSEIAPVERAADPVSAPAEISAAARRRIFFSFLKDYWAQILFIIASMGAVFAAALNHPVATGP